MKYKNLIIILVIASVIGVYLNRVYAHIYNHIDSENLASLVFDYNSPILLGDNLNNKITYVAMGDSLTYGVGANSVKNTFPYRFAESLSVDSAVVELSNFGVPGATVNDVIDFQLDKTIELQPDYVSIFIGINDIHQLIIPNEFASSLAYLLERLSKETRAKIIVINLPYLGSGNLVSFPYNYLLDWRTKQYNKYIEDITLSYGFGFVDLYDNTFDTFKENQDFYSSDGFHPSDLGYQFWSRFIYAN